jgi:hypothetical protein
MSIQDTRSSAACLATSSSLFRSTADRPLAIVAGFAPQ